MRSFRKIKAWTTNLVRLLLWNVNRRFRKRGLVNTRQGKFKIVFDVEDSISRLLFIYRQYHAEHVERALSFLKTHRGHEAGQGAILDVGANSGVISIGMLVKGQMGRAIALEPDPINYSLLLENIELNQLGNVMLCLNVAASDRQSSLQLELSADNYGDHRIRIEGIKTSGVELLNESTRATIPVRADKLDTLIEELDPSFTDEIALVWIDIQGHEGFAFQGARQLFSRDIPVVSEIWPYGILRSGQSLEDFHQIVSSIWSHYWVWRRGNFVRYPVETFPIFLEELGTDGDFDDVIFTN